MNETAIAWTDYTWNLFSGCRKISPECAHCYADSLAEQRRGTAAFPHGFDLTVRPHKLAEPARLLKSKGPSLIFCESMSDIGLEDGELSEVERARLLAAGYADMDHLRDAFFGAIEATPEHRYQVLTKRPWAIQRWLRESDRRIPSCVWFGVTIGHPKSMGRLGHLHTIRRDHFSPGAVAFISAEPLLDDLAPAIGEAMRGIDWIIGGGESGLHVNDPMSAGRPLVYRKTHLRPSRDRRSAPKVIHGEWCPTVSGLRAVANLRDLARASGTAFFFKQWGGPRPDSGGRLLDGRTWDELPTVPGALPERRVDIGGAATAALARKRLPVTP